MLKKNILYVAIMLNILTSCDNLDDDFFISLLDIQHPKLTMCCSDNELISTGNGVRNEVYDLADNTFQQFKEKLGNEDSINLPKANVYSNAYNKVLFWKKTPIQTSDTLILNVNRLPWLKNKCFTAIDLRKILLNKGSFYGAYYNKEVGYAKSYDGAYSWFILDGKSRKLFIIKRK